MNKLNILVSAPKNNSAPAYVEALRNCGANVTVEYLPKYDASYSGLLLSGGSDVDPKFYNEELNGSVGMDPKRDEAELALIKAFIDAGKPVMGVCRGHQILNVYFGGSLYQDIEEAELHKGGKAHIINTEENSVLCKLYGSSFAVNSTHHQAVKKPGEGLRVTATRNGKVVEACEHVSLPVISVQWHPETMCFSRKREDTVDGEKIIRYFVDMCK